MTNSKSSSLVIIILATFLLGWSTAAEAGGRKRIVVLEFDGPKAEKFQEEVIKLLKKSHTVVSTEKWNGTAEELDATKVTEKNVKKVAKKLKIDGVIQGKVEKRRDEYIVKLKLRNKDGDIVASPDTKWDGPKLEGKALRDVKDELITVVENLEANRGGGDDDEADKPAKKVVKKGGEDDEDKPVKKVKKGEDDEDKPVKKVVKKGEDDDEDKPAKGFGKKKLMDDDEDKPVKKVVKKGEDDDEDKPVKKVVKKGEDDDEDKPAKKVVKKVKDDDEDSPLPKVKKGEDDDDDGETKPAKKKKVADGDDDDGGSVDEVSDEGSGDKAAQLSPSQRAVDLTIGMSVMARSLGFTYEASLGAAAPPGYKGAPVAGVLIDATIYPLAVSHKREGMIKNLGFSVMLDKVIKVSSQYRKQDMTVGTLDSSAMRYALGGVFRYPFNKTALSPVIGASIRFGGQSFEIGAAADRAMADIPNVAYTMIDPGVFMKYPVNDKITLNVNLAYMAFLDTGEIQTKASYGAATVTGFEGEVSGDYMVTKNIFARAAFKFETIGFKFSGNGDKANRDGDPAADVLGARDTYLGGAVTVGYVY